MITPTTFTLLINQLLPEPHASLLAGMIFGVKTTMPRDFYQDLISTGTLHVVALSGMNITILINVMGSIFLVFGRRIASLLTILWIVLFMFFVGPSANVVRASLMGIVSLVGIYTGRPRYGLLTLLSIGVVMLTIEPKWLFDIGFQLSFLSTLGIMLLGEGGVLAAFIHKSLRSTRLFSSIALKEASPVGIFLKTIQLDLRTTLSAQLFTMPVMILTFKQLSLVAPLTNVLVGWVIQPITVCGLIMVVAAWVFLPLGQIMAIFLWPMLEYFIVIVTSTANLPFAYITWR